VQAPQWSRSARSGASAAVVKMLPRNSHEPNRRETRLLCLPCQPMPAASAKGFSITGAVSTKTLTPAPVSPSSQRPIALSFPLITL